MAKKPISKDTEKEAARKRAVRLSAIRATLPRLERAAIRARAKLSAYPKDETGIMALTAATALRYADDYAAYLKAWNAYTAQARKKR